MAPSGAPVKTGTGTRAKARTTVKPQPAGKFLIGEFLVTTLSANPRGMRPVELAKLVAEAAPGRHKDPQAITSTTLARLKAHKQVTNSNGIWSAVKS